MRGSEGPGAAWQIMDHPGACKVTCITCFQVMVAQEQTRSQGVIRLTQEAISNVRKRLQNGMHATRIIVGLTPEVHKIAQLRDGEAMAGLLPRVPGLQEGRRERGELCMPVKPILIGSSHLI